MASGFNVDNQKKSILHRLSWWAYCLLLVASVIPIIVVSRLVYRDVRAFTSSGKRNSIAITAQAVPVDWEMPAQTSGKHTKDEPSSTDMDDDGSRYFDDTDRRKAASALARNGDVDSALALLNADRDGRGLSRGAAQTGIAKLREAMPVIWDAQMTSLRTYWASLTDEEQNQLYQKSRTALAADLTVALTADGVERLEIIRLLPDSIWFTMVSSIHVGLAKDSPLPVNVIKLFLDPMIREERYPNQLYWKSSEFTAHPVDDHTLAYNSALQKHVLWPILKSRAEPDQAALRSKGKQWAAWYESAWGVTFCREFRELDLNRSDARQLFPWKALVPQTRNLWADRLLREFKAQTGSDLAPMVINTNPWLRDNTKPVDPTFVLKHIKSYPDWQNALRVFDYDAAEAAALDALKTLQAGKFYIRTRQSGKTISLETLTSDLTNEKKAFISSKFPWLDLIAELGGVNEGVPNAIRKKRGWKPNPKMTGTLWKDIKPASVLAALKVLRQKNPGKKRIFDRLITVYAANRNLDVKREK